MDIFHRIILHSYFFLFDIDSESYPRELYF